MKCLEYPLYPGDSVNRWLEMGILQKPMNFESMTMTGEINNRWLIEGFAIHENPTKSEFVNERKKEEVLLLQGLDGAVPSDSWEIYFPWQNPWVDHSDFWYVPTYLQTWAVTYLYSEGPITTRFRLSTAGGATMWVNREFVVDHTPYNRNNPQPVTVVAQLKTGWNQIVMRYDDLAERDTVYGFRLQYLGDGELKMGIPAGSASIQDVLAVEKALDNSSFPRDTFREGLVSLEVCNPLNTDLLVRCNHTIERGDPCAFSLTWPKGAKELVLKDVSEFAMGYTFLTCQIKLGPVSIKRDYGFQIAQAKEQSAKAATLKERKRMALEFISKWGEPNIHRALAILATDGDAKGAEKLVLRAIREINHRFDCSDFELIMVFKLWKTYREKGVFPEKVWDKLEEAILGFRYWFDEPGNDVMWFFSENHALLFHTCQLLAGQLFPDRIFSNAGITGSEHQQKARRRLDDWFARFFSEGYAEWNSSAYLPINVMGLLQILEYVDDAPLKDKAKQALDLTFRYIAIHSLDGYLACSHGRIYEKELKGNYGNQTTNMAWIAWGLANINHTTYANVALSLSDYVPPQDYVEYAALRPGQRLEYMFHQGPVEYADLYAHKTADYLLTSAIEFAPRPKGYQEHVLHASFGAEANLWVNHPGERAWVGSGRPSYWSGNGYLPRVTQYQNFAIALFDIGQEHDVDFTHAYAPLFAFDQYRLEGNWLFVAKNGGYAGLYSILPIVMQTEGPFKGRELIALGRKNAWVLRLADREEFATWGEFCAAMQGIHFAIDEHGITFIDPFHGEIHYGKAQSLAVNGAPVENLYHSVEGKLTIKGSDPRR